MYWRRPFKRVAMIRVSHAAIVHGQILYEPLKTGMSVDLTVPITMVSKRTLVCWTASWTICENLKKPKPSQPQIPPKDNRSVCILQALFCVKKSLF